LTLIFSSVFQVMTHGGARQGAGRKKKASDLTLKELLDGAWPDSRKEKAIEAQAKLAEQGDTRAFLALMAYTFGRPIEHHEIAGPLAGGVILKWSD
jgi:hypothetical protein